MAPPSDVLTTNTGAVLPDRETERMLGFPWGVAEAHWGAIAVWRPTDHDLRELEQRLPSEFRSTLDRAILSRNEDPVVQVTDYYRQYAGFTRRDGSHGILVQGLHRFIIDHMDSLMHERRERGQRAYFPDWRTEYVGVGDGGLLSFRASYRVERQAFDSLRFNPRFGGPVVIRPKP